MMKIDKNLWIAMTLVCSQEKRNIKFNFSGGSSMVLKIYVRMTFSVEPSVVKPVGTGQMCRDRMLDSVLIIY